MIEVERTDFISVPVTDLERSTRFYEETLGLTRIGREGFPEIGREGFPEFQLGENVSLYLLKMESIGMSFTGPHTASIALRVPDVAEGRRALEAKGVEFDGETFDTGVCHMANFKDPDGNPLTLHKRYAPYDEGSAS
jgi:catechol 2,3-dioxygenase-like lactoylglutathione lyase family enzyme